ncbi:MAG: hypothetical protein COV08_02905 [Candidatus Vogelbacteria bacterium CG10_big_fil_rev_8_21_14_0_10_49_38]|uniref:Uracil-DNA glycosylase-like domain-containing protein n=1 Tax=Candidatus Vogelbacteria bacterium CG10_big_fil_rev_8_21_14_0_10_49_38 TaxID=1975043 RepID=A0A2H0RHA7_9BACT|nr:MAG: hypothetical protein BK006_02915 [bacterium CG10_49_38]PIR45820.1 MAG: hypothetical protein COV08_02905 [Candidatus Vogelbacteria bacterium CG10_big_fil_rev_8_21_14_0_10_49_38]
MKNKSSNFFEQYRKQCEKCNHGKKVVIPANDPSNGQHNDKIDILFINERPGPTSIKTGFISFGNQDESAKRFKRLFEKVFGLKYRKRIFITNAVLWCPKVEKYKNKTPTILEIKCSSEILLNQIKSIKPKIIVAMGRSALNVLNFCFNEATLKRAKKTKLKNIVGSVITVKSYKIIPLFHTSPLNIGNRSESEQLKDWKKMARKIK